MDTPSTLTAHSAAAPYAVALRDGDGHAWSADMPEAQGGGDIGPTPEALLLASLGACTAITLRMYAARKDWPLTGVRVELVLNPQGKPGAGTEIERRVALEGELDAGQRERLLQIANACPIHKLLSGEVRIQSALAD